MMHNFDVSQVLPNGYGFVYASRTHSSEREDFFALPLLSTLVVK